MNKIGCVGNKIEWVHEREASKVMKVYKLVDLKMIVPLI